MGSIQSQVAEYLISVNKLRGCCVLAISAPRAEKVKGSGAEAESRFQAEPQLSVTLSFLKLFTD